MMTDHRNIFLLSFFILFSIGLFGQNSVFGTFDTDISKNKIKLYTTAKDTDLRLTRGDDHFFKSCSAIRNRNCNICQSKDFSKVFGNQALLQRCIF